MSEDHPIEGAFTVEEMHLAGIYRRALTGCPTDFDRAVQEYLDRLELFLSGKKGICARNGH